MMQRPLTALEQDAVRIVADRAASIVRDVWHEVMPIELAISGFEAAPEILQVAAREDPVLVANIEVSATNVSSLVMICLPFASLEEYFTSADTRRVSSTAKSMEELRTQRKQTERSLRSTSVSVAARLPEFQPHDEGPDAHRSGLCDQTPGLSANTLLNVTVAGQPRLGGHGGAHRRQARRAHRRWTHSLTTASLERSRPAEQDTP